MDAPALFELDAVGFERSGRHILADVTWSVAAGDRWAVLGPNGCGTRPARLCSARRSALRRLVARGAAEGARGPGARRRSALPGARRTLRGHGSRRPGAVPGLARHASLRGRAGGDPGHASRRGDPAGLRLDADPARRSRAVPGGDGRRAHARRLRGAGRHPARPTGEVRRPPLADLGRGRHQRPEGRAPIRATSPCGRPTVS